MFGSQRGRMRASIQSAALSGQLPSLRSPWRILRIRRWSSFLSPEFLSLETGFPLPELFFSEIREDPGLRGGRVGLPPQLLVSHVSIVRCSFGRVPLRTVLRNDAQHSIQLSDSCESIVQFD